MINLLFCSFLLLAGGGPGSVLSDSTGIEGRVVLIAGNQMPSPDRKPAPPQGARATLCLFELTGSDQVIRLGQSPYYSAVKTRMLRQVDTDDKGYFRVFMPPGRYSLFIKKS